MGLLVAGSRATGTTASWLILYLAAYPEWGRRAREESFSLLSRYSSANLTQFASIPLEAWESETPVMDAIISETLRVAQPHTAMRRNLGPDAWIDNVRIPSGAYVVYPFSDVHLNPDLYPEPFAWKPERREPRNVMFGSIRWGSGDFFFLFQYSILVLTSLKKGRLCA
jgi:sterol 14-demethylase